MTTYTVTVPFAGQWLTANPKSTADRYGRSGVVKDWRVSTVFACKAAKLPTGLDVPVTIHAVCYYTGRAPVRDNLNLAPTLKAIVDGMTVERRFSRKYRGTVRHYVSPGYGLLVDDDDRHVLQTTWELKPTVLQPRVELIITEVRA